MTNLANPILVGTFDREKSSIREVVVKGNYAFLAGYYNGFQIIDVSDPTNPSLFIELVGEETSPAFGVVVEGDYAYVTTRKGLKIIEGMG